MIGEFAFRFAKLPIGGRVVGMVARATPCVIPGLIFRSRHVVILKHPRPIAATHLVAVPRIFISDTEDSSHSQEPFLDELASWWLRRSDQSVQYAFTNVGTRQEVGLLHVHLVSGENWEPSMAIVSSNLSQSLDQTIQSALSSSPDASARTYFFRPEVIKGRLMWVVDVKAES